jgi:hypothetical protein
MVLVLGDAGDTHFDRRSSLEQDRFWEGFVGRLCGTALWDGGGRDVSSSVDLGFKLLCGSQASEALFQGRLTFGQQQNNFFFLAVKRWPLFNPWAWSLALECPIHLFTDNFGLWLQYVQQNSIRGHRALSTDTSDSSLPKYLGSRRSAVVLPSLHLLLRMAHTLTNPPYPLLNDYNSAGSIIELVMLANCLPLGFSKGFKQIVGNRIRGYSKFHDSAILSPSKTLSHNAF